MKRFKLLLFFSALALSCVHKPFTALIPAHTVVNTTSCDTEGTGISYTKQVKPVLSQNCYSCHGSSVTTGGGLDLEDFSNLKGYLQNGFRGDGIYGSKLFHCILHSPNALPMPPTYIIDTCSLKYIKRWIDMGAPDN